MITNLFVDASVLAFPPQVDNTEADCENVKKFLKNINKLLLIEKTVPNITLFIKNDIAVELGKCGYNFRFDKNQMARITRTKKDAPDFNIDPRDIFIFYQELLNSSNDKQIIRFNDTCTIQEIDKNLLEIYHESAVVCTDKYFEDEYKKLVSYVSYLNGKYNNTDSCYIAICGKKREFKANTVKITTAWKLFDRNKESINVFSSLENAYKHAKNETVDALVFGENIEDMPNISIVYNDHYNYQPIPSKIYHYLTTLAEVTKKSSINESTDEKSINKIVRMFGCISSSEYENNYLNCPYRRWHDGKTVSQFLLHLKPTTSPHPDTTRIYYKYDKEQKKMVVGMILEHPINCGDCKREGKDTCSTKYTIGSMIREKRRYD